MSRRHGTNHVYREAKAKLEAQLAPEERSYVIVASKAEHAADPGLVGCLWDARAKNWTRVDPELTLDDLRRDGLAFTGRAKCTRRYSDHTQWGWRYGAHTSSASMDAMSGRPGLWVGIRTVAEWRAGNETNRVQPVAEGVD